MPSMPSPRAEQTIFVGHNIWQATLGELMSEIKRRGYSVIATKATNGNCIINLF